MIESKNLFLDLESLPDVREEIFETLLQTNNIRIEKIISIGQSSPEGFWYDQDENEWVVVLEGEASIMVENELKILKRGDFLSLPAHTKHRVEYTKNRTIWLAVFYE